MLTKYYWDGQTEDEMRQICGKYGAEIHTWIWWGNLKKKPLWRPRHRQEDNIKMDLNKTKDSTW